jgi:hypothetical protein
VANQISDQIYDNQLVYVDAIFQIAWEGDHDDAFFWRPSVTAGQREWRAFANCSDLFHWATADAEEVRPEDVPLLRQTLTDLKAIEKDNAESVATAWLPELYAARKRGMRPQGAFYAVGDIQREPLALVALFDAAGPERDDPDGKKRTIYDQEADAA